MSHGPVLTAAEAARCELYPMGLPASALREVVPGSDLDGIVEGIETGQFGWLSWSGSPSELLLAQSLEPPGNSGTYVNPEESRDQVLSPGDWVCGKPGVSNSRGVRDALDALRELDVVVPVWDAARGAGAHTQYRISGFARVRLLEYRLGGRGRIHLRFLGFEDCVERNGAPVVNAGPDQNAWWGERVELEGTVRDDGLPPGARLRTVWSQVEGPGTVTFEGADALATVAHFDQPGSYRLRLEASDTELSGADELTVAVAQPNRPPVALPMAVELLEDGPRDLWLEGMDPDRDSLRFTLIEPPARGTLSGEPPSLRYVPLPDFSGADAFSFVVSDGALNSAEAVVDLIVLPVNDAPIADSQAVTLLEDDTTEITLTGVDLEGSPLVFRVFEWPRHGTLTGTPPKFIYTPIPDFAGTDRFDFRVNDGELDSAAAGVLIEVQPVNDPPTVAAGLDQVFYLDQSGSLAGVVTDDGMPSGASLEWHWSVVSGPGVAYVEQPEGLAGNIQFDVPGVYVLRLSATDTLLSAFDELTITVLPRNHPPTVQAGEDQLIAFPASASLAGSASDDGLPEGGRLFALWEKAEGPGMVTFTTPNAWSTLVLFDAPGRYRLRLTVTDTELTASHDLEIIVNQTPTAQAGPDRIATVGLPIQFHGEAVDDQLPTGQIRGAWSRLDGPAPALFAEPEALEPEVTFQVPGEYHFRLTVTDGHLSAQDDLRVLVRPAGENLPPRVDAGPDRYIARTHQVQMLGTVVDDGLPLERTPDISWSLLAGPGLVDFDTSTLTNAVARFDLPGVYQLQLTAYDGEFLVADSVSIAVYPDNQPPVVCAGTDQAIHSGPAQLAGIVTDDGLPAGSTLAFRWELDHGPGDVRWDDPLQPVTRAAFSEPGVYTLRLIASDSEFEASAHVTVTVNGNQAPWVDAGPDQLLDLFVPGQGPPSVTHYPPLPARWDLAVGQPGLAGSWVRPNSLAYSGSALYLGGAFSTAAGLEVRSLARWDGCHYSPLYDPRPITPDDPNSAPIGFIAHHGVTEPVTARGDEVFVAGGFLRDLSQDGFLDFTARWSGTGWEPWGFKIASAYVTARAFLATPDAVYFAGQFKFQTSNISTAPVSFNLARWNGEDWETLGEGIRDVRDTPARNAIQYAVVNALARAANGDLYAGGQFTFETPSGLAVNLARWDGVAWAPVSPLAFSGCRGGGCAPAVHALAFDANGDLYVGGNFTAVGNLSASSIARWDGRQWWPVGDGFNHIVQTLVMHQDALFAGGEFTHAGARLVNRVARWDGTAWHSLEHGVSGIVCALATTPSGLYLGGNFTYANGQPSSLIAKWGHEERLCVAGPDPVTVPGATADTTGAAVPLTLEVRHPCGQRLIVAWSVDGADPVRVDQLEEGTTATPVALSFEHFYLPGVHSVVATLDDGVGEPVLFSTTVTVLTPATTTLDGWVHDDGLPSDGTLVTGWESVAAPAPVLLHDPSSPNTLATFSAPGSYRLEFTADDTEFAVPDHVEITVRPVGALNLPPSAHAGRDRTAFLSESLTLGGVAIDDALPGPDLQVDWLQLEGPALADLDVRERIDLAPNPGSRSATRHATVRFPLPGQYRFRCVVDDAQFSRSDEVVIHVLDLVNHAPTASAGPSQVVGVFSEAMLFASAQDDGLPHGTLFTGWTQMSGPGSTTFHRDNDTWLARFDRPGDYQLRFTAHDGTLTAHADVSVSVVENLPGPAVSLTAPVDGERITATCAISGAVSGDLLQSWQLLARPVPAAADLVPPWTLLAQGTSAVQGALGAWDPTLLPNGLYELRLEALDRLGRSVASDPLTILLDGQYKPGRLTLEFIDLVVPVAGLPLRVVRAYDSHRARLGEPGDFGVGWRLQLGGVTLRKQRPLSRNWQQLGTGGWYQLDPVRPREVVITFPDDRVCRFRARLNPDLQFGYPIATARLEFDALPGTPGRLEVEEANLATIDGFTGPVDLVDIGSFAAFEPTRFRYTTPEGDAYVIDERAGLESVADRHGHTLTIDPYGIHHSSGLSVRFLRDAQGFLTDVVDPAGQTLRYQRDHVGNLVKVTDRDGATTSLDYHQAPWPHQLSQITGPLGRPVLRAEYDPDGRMIRQIDAHGRAFEFNRDLARRHELIRDRAGYATLLEYDDRGNLTRRTDPLGAVTSYNYDAFDQVIRRVDPLGHITTFTYDAQFNLLSQTDPLGHITRFTYDARRQLTSVTDPRGYTISYDHAPRLVRVIHPSNATTALGLNDDGLLAALTNALGYVTRFDYDPQGRLLRETDPQGRITEFQHDNLGRPVQFDTTCLNAHGFAESLQVRLDYNSMDRITRAIAPDGAQVLQEFDAAGNLTRQEDALGRSTVFLRDSAGRQVGTRFPDQTEVRFGYDPEGRLIAVTNALDQVTRIQRDPLGRPVAVVLPDGATASAQYDLAGNVVALTDARGATTEFTYDAADRLIAITNPLGEITRFEHDPNGNRTAIRNAAGHQTHFDYDPQNRLVAIRHPDGSSEQLEYDALGRRVAEIDPAGLSTRFGYLPNGKLSSVTNAAGYVARFEYDALGRCRRQIDAAGRVTHFDYDLASRPTRRTLPGGASESFVHDPAGNLVAHTDFNGRTTGYTYDALDRLLERVPDPAFGAPANAYTYDALGSRLTMTDGAGVTRYRYDARNRRTAKSWQPAGLDQTLTLEYEYDPAGNLVGLRSNHPNGVQLRYEYDALNRLSQVIDPGADAAAPLATTYTYDAAGNLAAITQPNGIHTRHQHDALRRLTNSLGFHSTAGTIAEFGYTLDATGRRLSAFSWIAGDPADRRHHYAYDPLHQLTGETVELGNSRGQLGYTYDPVGNRLARTASGSNLGTLSHSAYLYDADDRLLTDRYDANGNTLQSTLPAPFHFPVTDIYDFENRLVSRTVWVEGQPWTIHRVYDGDGRLAAQSVDGVTTYYLVDDLNPTGHSQVLEELAFLNQTLTPTRVQTFGHALLHQATLEVAPDNQLDWQVRFPGTDAHGHVRYLTDPAGTVTDTWDYDAFGNLLDHSGPSDNPHLFAGERWDPNLRLYDLRARLYQPDTGRFWTRDPFPGLGSLPASLHPYLFAENDPVNRLDPDGHFSAISMSLGVTYGLSLRNIYNGVSLQVGFGLIQTLEGLDAGRSDEQILVDYLLASTRDVALGFGTAYAARALWPALLRVASRPLAALSQTYSRSSTALNSWRNGTTLAARELVGRGVASRLQDADKAFSYYLGLARTLDVRTPRNAAVFYSGPGNRARAEAFARSNGRLTLEMTPGGTWLDAQRLFDNGSPLSQDQAREVWSIVSQRYASHASGTAIGFVVDASPSGIFNLAEYPALLDNAAIINVITGGN